MFRCLKILAFLMLFNAEAVNAEEPFFKAYDKIFLRNVEITDLKNKKIKIDDIFENENYIINFWATWCLPCKKELPELQKIHTELREKKIKTYIISIDKKNTKEQLFFLKENNIDVLVPFFDKKMNFFNSLKLRGIPTTLLINKKNKMAMKEGVIKYSYEIMDELNIFFN